MLPRAFDAPPNARSTQCVWVITEIQASTSAGGHSAVEQSSLTQQRRRMEQARLTRAIRSDQDSERRDLDDGIIDRLEVFDVKGFQFHFAAYTSAPRAALGYGPNAPPGTPTSPPTKLAED